MTDEIWKDIEGYEGRYMVSNYGRIKNCARNKYLTPSVDSYGYLRVWLGNKKDRKIHSIHRLVAVAFLPNPFNLPQVNHKDEDRSNPYVGNLEWCTAQYNTEYSQSVNYAFIIPTGKVLKGRNLCKLCKAYGLEQSSMSRVHTGQAAQHKGWRKYVPINV